MSPAVKAIRLVFPFMFSFYYGIMGNSLSMLMLHGSVCSLFVNELSLT